MKPSQHSFSAPTFYSSELSSVIYNVKDADVATADGITSKSPADNFGYVPDGEIIRITFETANEETGKSSPIIYLY